MGAAANDRAGQGARRGFSERARQAASLHAHGYSRKQTAQILEVAPETVSVWKRHPQWQQELARWRALAEVPLDPTQQRLAFESLHATLQALEQLRLLMKDPEFSGGSRARLCPGGRRCSGHDYLEEVPR